MFPDELKYALIKPQLKKRNLVANKLNNRRPVPVHVHAFHN